MSWLGRVITAMAPTLARIEPSIEPRAAIQSGGGGITITTAAQLETALQAGGESLSGATVTPETAMRVAAVYGCVRLIAGAVATMPMDVMRWLGPNRREEAREHPLWKVLKRRPNRWQTPSQFKRMMEAHKLLRGNAYAYVVWSVGRVIEVIPLHPDRVRVIQLDDLSLEYHYTGKNGVVRTFSQAEIFHLVGLTLDGFRGVTPITYARETIGMSLSMERHGANMFRNGTQIGSVFKLPKGSSLNDAQYARLKAGLDTYRTDGEKAGGTLLLEDGMEIDSLALSAVDAQWIESRKLSRSDIAMFYGVPPHMLGDTEKSTSWGTGIDSQTQGFVTFVLEDHLTPWEETCQRDLLRESETDIYIRFNRAALVRGDLKTRQGYYQSMLQWGVMSPDEVRALEDMNPRQDGEGGNYYDPPNTAGGQPKQQGDGNDPSSNA